MPSQQLTQEILKRIIINKRITTVGYIGNLNFSIIEYLVTLGDLHFITDTEVEYLKDKKVKVHVTNSPFVYGNKLGRKIKYLDLLVVNEIKGFNNFISVISTYLPILRKFGYIIFNSGLTEELVAAINKYCDYVGDDIIVTKINNGICYLECK
ncbi:hypothetical protein COV24_03480 [candidate division WWE3 bacterium CG10_big_fil_rev_8_21_14_0_10_32_10]|uniref:Uncharacterized protein n=1 Tax=candidate division WWE3 bacterium CG10_big_fil_rev_8_21_14_0_10_32_10 TaxID=1975090 RepID=A0A2H0RB91_UNCKA|nr:MAG: hypothetical protein COV24_03480 [candidate division WWE3 bacterium CG10_big_fil_rev_8_21_14_0_10_32_10]